MKTTNKKYQNNKKNIMMITQKNEKDIAINIEKKIKKK